MKSLKRLALASFLASALAGCMPQTSDRAAGPENETLLTGGGLGAYLAGRFAQAHGDTAAAATFFTQAARRDPESADLQQRAFTLLLAEGRLDDAAGLASRLLIIDPEAPLPSLMMGVRAARLGQMAEAEKFFTVLPAKGVNSFLGPLLTAWVLTGKGDVDKALSLLATSGETEAFAPVYEFHRALISEVAGRPEDAERFYAKALAVQTSVRIVEATGSFYQRQGRMDDAARLYARYQKEHHDRALFDGARPFARGTALPPLVPTVTEGLAEALFDTASLLRQGNAHDLVLVFARLAQALRPDFPMAQIVIADTLGQQRRLADANAVYRAISRDAQVWAFARLRLAVNLDELGRTDEAVAELKDLAATDPTAHEPVMALGDVYRRHKRFPEAAQAYDRALALTGGANEARNWSLFYARGIALERSGQWPLAEQDMKQALRLKPDQPDVLNYLGYTWVDQGINLAEGRKLIEKAVELRPRDGAIVDSLGWALYRLGDYPGAVRYLERAVELKAEDPTINEHLGDALWQVGRHAEALYQWERALILDPEPEQIEGLKERIETGRVPPSSLKKGAP